MTSKKHTEWGGASDAELAPVMRVVDFVLIYAALWLPTYARGEAWDQRSWAAATIAAVLFMIIGQSLRLYQSARGARLNSELVRIWAGWFVGVVPVLLFLLFISKRSEDYSRFTISTWFLPRCSLWFGEPRPR
jgi:FlaA1/EpsC-like NDP-sugar epimerase